MPREINLHLPSVDDLFTTQEQRDDDRREKVINIPISFIDDFPGHPFQVKNDEAMQSMAESVKAVGIQTPAIVRQKDDGRYELISGHRRKMAFRPAVELSYLPAEQQQSLVETMQRDEATPSLAQAMKMKQFSQGGKLNENVILSIMSEEKPNQKEVFKMPRERLAKYFPEGVTPQKIEDTIIKALELWRKRERDRDSR